VYRVNPWGTSQMKTLPSSEAEAMMRSLKGFLCEGQPGSFLLSVCRVFATHQSVSSTAAVWPRKSGIWSGSLPRSFRGMTANAPPPPDSQLTERYSGLTCQAPGVNELKMRLGGAARENTQITHLHQVGIPGIAADVEVVVAKLLLGGLSKDVSWSEDRSAAVACEAAFQFPAQRSGARRS
jgi:hypothetical protein